MLSPPFVLLDDARPGGRQTLYRDPVETIVARAPGEVRPAFARLRQALGEGRHAAGFIGYEAGAAIEPKLAPLARAAAPGEPPLLWFGLFERAEALAPGALSDLLGDPAGAWAGAPRPLVTRNAYDAALARVQELIAAGDIYQANLSFRAEVPVLGDPRALYARLRGAAGAGWGGIVHDGQHWLLSFSPELFFRIEEGRIEARPMKGTGPRGSSAEDDAAQAARLAADPKERAENLMIVDLIRNDLSRVATAGSVRVPELFVVETYPTIQTMVSVVEADLLSGRDAIDVLEALFPCGSITGAPKIRAMEVIAEVEADARGIYTGAIGYLSPDGSASFNVAIRTLAIEGDRSTATIGLGGAVVADSTAEGEWAECLAKGAFVTRGGRLFDLIETMRFDPRDGLLELDRHLARLGASAHALGFRFDRHAARNDLHAATFRLREPARVRLLLGRSGATAIEARPIPTPPGGLVTARVAPLPVDPADFRLAHKTSDRDFHDAARRAAGAFEVVFVRPDGLLTEGSFTNLFAVKGGRLATPPLKRGLLPGVLRASLLETGDAIEEDLTIEDLRDGFYLGNALRGLMAARLVE